MIVIENEGKLQFFEGKQELTLREGFQRLEVIYSNEPQETKKIIDRLKEQYYRLS